MFDFKNIILFITSFFNFYLGFFIYIKDKKSASNRAYTVVAFSVAVWAIGMIFFRAWEEPFKLLVVGRSLYISAGLIVTSFLYFCLIYPVRSYKLKLRQQLFILTPTIFIFFLIIFTDTIIHQINVDSGEPKLIFGYLYWLYGFYIVIYFIIAFYLIIKKFVQATGLLRFQLRYILIGGIISAILGASTNLFLSGFGHFTVFWLGPIFTLIMVFCISYAIIRYRLLNIRFAITRSLLFSILVTIVGTAITFGLILINKFINIESTRHSLIANLFIAVVIVLSFNPLKNKLAKLTDAIFFKDQTDPQEILRIIGTAVARDLKLEELLVEFSDLFKNLIKLKKAQILIGGARGNHFAIFNPTNNHNHQTIANHNHQLDSQAITAPPEQCFKDDYKIIVDYFTQNPEIKVTEEEERRAQDLKDGPRKTELAAIVKALNNIDMELVIPVSLEIKSESAETAPAKNYTTKRLVNAIILTGAKVNGEIFDNRDIKLFSLLAAQLATALEKSKLYERVKRFNLELKKKIQIATQKLAQANIELIASNKELKQLDKAKSLFLSIAAHQLRTPLTGIKGYISMFLEGDFGPLAPKQIEIMKGVFSSSNRLTRLINTFLNVSRIEAGRLRLDKTPVDLKELCQTVITDLKEIADDKNLKLELDAPEKLDQILLDKDKIEDVLINLTDNAIKYTQTGKITLRLRQLGGKIRVEVQDTGVGISKKEADGLFNKFVRGKKALKMHTDGAGLGLFIVKKLIEAHKGEVGVESAGSGHGSIFWFEAPIEE